MSCRHFEDEKQQHFWYYRFIEAGEKVGGDTLNLSRIVFFSIAAAYFAHNCESAIVTFCPDFVVARRWACRGMCSHKLDSG